MTNIFFDGSTRKVFTQLRIPITAFLSKFITGAKYTTLQWIMMTIIIFACFSFHTLAQGDSLAKMDEAKKKLFVAGLLVSILSSGAASAGSLVGEKYLKAMKKVPFPVMIWRMQTWSVIFSILALFTFLPIMGLFLDGIQGDGCDCTGKQFSANWIFTKNINHFTYSKGFTAIMKYEATDYAKEHKIFGETIDRVVPQFNSKTDLFEWEAKMDNRSGVKLGDALNQQQSKDMKKKTGKQSELLPNMEELVSWVADVKSALYNLKESDMESLQNRQEIFDNKATMLEKLNKAFPSAGNWAGNFATKYPYAAKKSSKSSSGIKKEFTISLGKKNDKGEFKNILTAQRWTERTQSISFKYNDEEGVFKSKKVKMFAYQPKYKNDGNDENLKTTLPPPINFYRSAKYKKESNELTITMFAGHEKMTKYTKTDLKKEEKQAHVVPKEKDGKELTKKEIKALTKDTVDETTAAGAEIDITFKCTTPLDFDQDDANVDHSEVLKKAAVECTIQPKDGKWFNIADPKEVCVQAGNQFSHICEMLIATKIAESNKESVKANIKMLGLEPLDIDGESVSVFTYPGATVSGSAVGDGYVCDKWMCDFAGDNYESVWMKNWGWMGAKNYIYPSTASTKSLAELGLENESKFIHPFAFGVDHGWTSSPMPVFRWTIIIAFLMTVSQAWCSGYVVKVLSTLWKVLGQAAATCLVVIFENLLVKPPLNSASNSSKTDWYKVLLGTFLVIMCVAAFQQLPKAPKEEKKPVEKKEEAPKSEDFFKVSESDRLRLMDEEAAAGVDARDLEAGLRAAKN